MTEPEICDTLTTLFRRQFKQPALVVRNDLTANDVNGWDSLAHIRLIIAVELAFAVKFRTSEIFAFKNVGDLVRMILAKQAAQGPA